MGYNKKKWRKLEGCDCWRCREVEVEVDCNGKHEDEKHEGNSFKCSDININVNCGNDKKDDDHGKGKDHDDKHDKDNGDKVEFKYDISNLNVEIFGDPIAVLQAEFNKVKAGDRISLSGIIGLDNDSDEDVTMLITILRTRDNGLSNIIYSQIFEVHEEGNNDRTQEPFAHVEVEQNDIRNVTYTVRIQRLENNVDIFLFGQSTLTAVRYS
ncbi:hypothetical protein [Paenisporosarcina sp.]|uniref:hypothetical protein n=1 Tax=Paenisporosarcina sp. TaxID=1932001 RepID=UPI003C70CAE0